MDTVEKAASAAVARVKPTPGGSDAWERPYSKEELISYDLRFNLERPWITDGVRRMAREAQWMLNDMAHAAIVRPRWLTLCAASGSGKTHLALRIRDIAREQLRYQKCQRWTVTRYADMLRSGNWDLQAHLERLDLLILDDLGAERMSDMIRASLYDLLNSRLGKWTVITSNVNLRGIAEDIDGRIASRLIRGGSVVIEVDDARDYPLAAQRAGEGIICRRDAGNHHPHARLKTATAEDPLDTISLWRQVMKETS